MYRWRGFEKQGISVKEGLEQDPFRDLVLTVEDAREASDVSLKMYEGNNWP